MIWGYGSAWFFTLIPNPTSKPPQTRLKTRFYQKSDFYGTSTLNSPYGRSLGRGPLVLKCTRKIPSFIWITKVGSLWSSAGDIAEWLGRSGRNHFKSRQTTVDGKKISDTWGPRGPSFMKILVFGGLGPGGPGAITNRRGMKKYPRGLVFVRLGWSYEGFIPIFEFWWIARIRIFLGF